MNVFASLLAQTSIMTWNTCTAGNATTTHFFAKASACLTSVIATWPSVRLKTNKAAFLIVIAVALTDLF